MKKHRQEKRKTYKEYIYKTIYKCIISEYIRIYVKETAEVAVIKHI